MIFIECSFLRSIKCIDNSEEITAKELVEAVSSQTGIPGEFFSVYSHTCKYDQNSYIPEYSTVHLTFQLPGGKGGFGSMLRAIGAQIEKTTNREACRDLSGRRLRDINEEQRLKKWLDKKVEREEEKERRRQERLERLKQLPKHDFNDPEYNKQRSELPDRIHDALSVGLKKKSEPSEAKAGPSSKGPPAKKHCPWPELNSSSESDGDEVSQEESTSTEVHCSSDTSTSYVSEASCSAPIPAVPEDAHTETLEVKSLEEEKTTDPDAPIECPTAQTAEGITEDVNSLKEEIMAYSSAAELENLGLERSKAILQAFGLKCGGTLSQRAERIWSIRGLEEKDIPKNLRARTK